MSTPGLLPTSFSSHLEENTSSGKSPVVLDLIKPDKVTRVLPEGLFLVMHVNPSSMKIKYTKVVTRTRTRGGYVEFHWGDGVDNISFENATGGFVRLTTGLSNKTGSSFVSDEAARGGRRETLAYDFFLDLLSMYLNNGSIYDTNGTIVSQGYVKITFSGATYLGRFENIDFSEDVSKPYQFMMSSSFVVDEEEHIYRTTLQGTPGREQNPLQPIDTSDEPLFDDFFRNQGTV